MQSVFDFIKSIHNNIIAAISITLTIIVGFIIYFLQKRDSKKIGSNKKTEDKNPINNKALRENILVKYPLDKNTKLPTNKNDDILCLNCIHKNPPIEQIIRSDEYYWICPKCDKKIKNDTPFATGFSI